jgi:hypothetical protein
MAKQVQLRRGSTVDHNTFTGANGEITIDGDLDTLVVHDGNTVGGFPLARQDLSNVTFSIGLDGLDIINAGEVGQVLQKDVNETLSFISLPDSPSLSLGGDLSGSISNANINPNTIGITELDIANGDVNFSGVLSSDGVGGLLFVDAATEIFLNGEVNGPLGNVTIADDIIDNANLKLNSVGINNIINDSINNDKIRDNEITDSKIIGLNANKLISGGTLPSLKGPEVTELPYDIGFVGGFDADLAPDDLEVAEYGKIVMARSGTFEGASGFIDITGASQPVIVDIEKNDVSIYSSKPFFADGNGSANMTTGTLSTNNTFVSGDRITFKVAQVGIGTVGQGIRFTLKCRV